MQWRRVDPVQAIGALILVGPGAPGRLAGALLAKSSLFRGLVVEHGQDWAAVFAGPFEGGSADRSDWVLPHLPEAVPLHEAAPGWWLPAGVVCDVPGHAEPVLWRALADRYSLKPPVILLPRFGGEGRAQEADLYPAHRAVPFDRSALAAA